MNASKLTFGFATRAFLSDAFLAMLDIRLSAKRLGLSACLVITSIAPDWSIVYFMFAVEVQTTTGTEYLGTSLMR